MWDKAECSFYNGPGCTLEKDHEGNVPKGPHVNKKGMELFDNALTLRSYICEPKQWKGTNGSRTTLYQDLQVPGGVNLVDT